MMRLWLSIFVSVLSIVVSAGTEHLIFQSSPGVSVDDLRTEKLPDWSQFEWSEDHHEIGLEMQVLKSFNLEAQKIWQELESCYEGDIELLRAEYLSNKLRCARAKVSALHRNTRNWLETTISEGIGRSNSRVRDPFIPLHPLLGQILVEAHAYYIKPANKIMDRPYDTRSPMIYGRIQSFQERCEKGFEYQPKCDEELPILNGYSLSGKLITSAVRYCHNFGFWPNAGIFHFSGVHETGHGLMAELLLEIDPEIRLLEYVGRNKTHIRDHVLDKYQEQPEFAVPQSCWQDLHEQVVEPVRNWDGRWKNYRDYGHFLEGFIEVYRDLYVRYSVMGGEK